MSVLSKLASVEQAIHNADTYEEYYEASLEHDALSGANEWKAEDKASEYDYKLIRKRVDRLKFAKAHGDPAGLMSVLHEGIHGNLGNIANPEMNHNAKIGTKYLIQEFLDQVCDALRIIYHADENEVDFYEKLSFFEETYHSFGQSCLMLSGGAGLGFFHCGVIKSLVDHDLMPNVISGASAGSIITAMVGTRTDAELHHEISAENIYEKFRKWCIWKGFGKGSLLDSTNLENALIEMFGTTTFEEAYKKTGRKITITVSPADLHQYPRLLNAKTSPNAIITMAVRASTAIPMFFTPVQLKAKNAKGEIHPYIPNRKFCDGSIMADMPFERLARLYGVNHSICSQTNPVAVPFLSRSKKHSKGILSTTKRHAFNLAKMNSIYAFDILENLVGNSSLKLGIHKVRSVVEQQYVGDINIIPQRSLDNVRKVFANPTVEDIAELIKNAEKATWPQLDLIRRNTQISKTFRKYLKLLKKREEQLLSGQHGLRLVKAG
ncbi:DUF3336 domain-containing protein [Paraneptunicella aestuarii]|uniref:DUF3336 domain-containing protein n=1 Tax=Paraneptunicella aestuarii TaxID=2831148 RepID=UPI001E5CF808|nr:DUF3336 domain-containing protein [Paraneptunicella aestuarii]UAA37931.1 DUF3336 domain-containing protein [Paraneptunicella aestuarii]